MTSIVILAISKRPDGRCLGGIDLETGEWVRPVPKRSDGIPTRRCFLEGRMLRLLDVLELDLFRPREFHEFQKENQIIRNWWSWKATRRLKLTEILKYVDPTTPVLHSPGDRVAPSFLRELPPKQWTSLQLVRPEKLEFTRHHWEPNRWVANFRDAKGNCYSLKVTDPEVTLRLEKGERISQRSLLTVSLTKPWSANVEAQPPLCYKIVAAVMELP